MNEELTPWRSGGEKPELAGLYNSDFALSKYGKWHRLWDGEFWFNGSSTLEGALKIAKRDGKSEYQDWPWRGLSNKPE